MTAMKREEIRKLKRAAAEQRDTEAMAVLLHRSVRFGHKKLALVRCIQAERMGIAIAPEVLSYCQEVADGMPPEALHKVLRQAGGRTV
jgi:hypothetical protein